MLTELEKAQELLKIDELIITNVVTKIGLEDYLKDLIKNNACSTIRVRYNLGNVYVIAVYPSGNKLQIFDNYNEVEFNEFCKETLNLDLNEQYNCSRTIIINGVRTRVFAMMPPFVKTPSITISTTKEPPATLTKQTISDETFNKIVHSNFIVVGASGSGKTYLTNYLLNKFIHEDESILLIEEFGELIPPNDLTETIVVPPPKPNEPSLLKFVTEQSNLMRLDAIYVGEIKGGEAWPMVVNMASGTRGGFTMHGETAKQALSRLRALCRLSCDNDEAINEFIAKSIKFIIVMKDKNIVEIQELMGTYNRNNFAMQEYKS